MPGNGKIAGNILDKVVHFGLFFFLAINICVSFKKRNELHTTLFLAFLLGLLTEFLQQYIPGRNMDLIDAIADTLGVLVAYLIYQKYETNIDHRFFKLGVYPKKS